MTTLEIADQLLTGSIEELAHRLFSAYQGGLSIASILDQNVAPAMWHVGDLWANQQIDIYQEHLASKHLAQVLDRMSEFIGTLTEPISPQLPNPVAIGCSVETEGHGLASKMVELTLQEMGWNATTFGSSLPAPSLVSAIRSREPDLVWVSYTRCDDPRRLIEANEQVFRSLGANQALVIGGQALTPELRREMSFDFSADNLMHLKRFAERTVKDLGPRSGQVA